MSTRVELAIERAVRDAAQTLEAATEPLKEKHLAQHFRTALAGQLASAQTGCKVDTGEFPLQLKEWPSVGRADLVIRSPIGDPFVLFELKWGSGTLYNCVWDLAKMAVALARGAAYRAYLVAGAPESDWQGSMGSGLFETGEWHAGDLLKEYREYWEFWRKDVKTHPLILPDVITTSAIASEPLRIADEPWELRVVQVAASPEDWVDVASGIKASRWLTHFTWQPGDLQQLSPAEVEAILKTEEPNPSTH